MSKGNWNRLRQFAFLCFGILFLILLYIIQDLKNQIQILQTEIWFVMIIISIDSWVKNLDQVRNIATRFFRARHAFKSATHFVSLMIWSKFDIMWTISKRDFLSHEIDMNLSSRYFDNPEIFRNVQEVPPIFTIRNFNFTTSEPDVTECECIEGENDIRWDSELQTFAKSTSAYNSFYPPSTSNRASQANDT